MLRLPVLAALLIAAVISASAWLAIDASSESDTRLIAEHLPRDDEQAQQQSQSVPEPTQPEEAEEEAEEQEAAGEEASEAITEEDQPDQADDAEAKLDPADVVIAALDIERPPVSEPEPELDQTAPSPTFQIVFETYVVEPGDTLADIARHFQVGLDDLIAANMLDLPDLLQIGRELAIPIEVEVDVEDPEPLAEPESAWQPDEVAPGVTESGAVYGTIHDHERGVINSAGIAMSHGDASIWLVEACIDGVRRTYIKGLSLPDEMAQIYWRFDDGLLNTDRWEVHEDRVESVQWCPFLHTADEVAGTKDIWIRIGDVDLTFTIANILPDELRANFLHCGG
jgi:LysM repeat protein